MSRRFEVWLNSGANHDSTYRTIVSLDELGLTSEEWDALTEDERDNVMRDIAFDRSDWGYAEVKQVTP